MKSFKFGTSTRKKRQSRLLFDIYQLIDEALQREEENNGLTRAEIARRLKKDKGALSRLLNGRSNMTIETWSDLAWAMDHVIDVSMKPISEVQGNQNTWHTSLPMSATASTDTEKSLAENKSTWTTASDYVGKFQVRQSV